MIDNLLNRDKKTRKKLGLKINETQLESKYLFEYNKFQKYCLNNSKFCQIDIDISYNNWFSKLILNPDKKESSVTYMFDRNSYDFFNSIQQGDDSNKGHNINNNVMGYKAVQFKPSYEIITLNANYFGDNFIDWVEEEFFLWQSNKK